MQVSAKINLDLLRPAVQVVVNAKQNDKASRFIQANLWEDGQPFAPESVLATFRVLKPDGTAAFYDTNEAGDPAITISGNVATIELVEQVLTVPGDVAAELNLYTADGEKLTSFTFTIRVQASVLNDAEIVSSDYFNVLTNTLTQAQAAADRAEAAADRAEDLTADLVKSVNGQTPDENGNVNVQAGVTSVFGREGAVTAENGDYSVGQISGAFLPNLLDNSNFLNPVNQKGRTSYSGAVYGIDRWVGTNRMRVELTAGGIVLSNTNPSVGMAYWQQLLETSRLEDGAIYTLVFVVDGTAYAVSALKGTTEYITPTPAVRVTLGVNTDGHTLCRIQLEAGATQSITVSSAALYKGEFTADTLPTYYARPYEVELLACQRYYQLFATEAARPTALVDYRPNMRATPATGTVTVDGATLYFADANP